jgi:ketosteroid isomerase-like protein
LPRILYSPALPDLNTDTDAVINATYAQDATFHDPVVKVHGKQNVKAQFRSLKAILCESKAEFISSGLDTHDAAG